MSLSVEDGFELINKAFEKRADEILMERWITHYQHEMTFDEFKNELTEISYTKKDHRSKEEILGMVYGIIGSMKGVDYNRDI